MANPAKHNTALFRDSDVSAGARNNPAERLVSLVRIYGRESCRDPRFVAWLVGRAKRG